MSFTIGEELASDQPNQSTCEIKRKSGISYSREFLLSLSELDICKKFPNGFDESILSEFEDMALERPRILGGLSSQGFRHNEYGSSSPPTRGELGNYGQGIHGRWESRSSGRTEKDVVSQKNRDSDPGGRYAIPSRRGWQAPEHDGLLGSGSFPRASGYIPGTSAPKLCSNDSYQRNRSTEPYQPPRPYKAAPSSRREITDSYNDETFGSSEWTNEDKTEEERKRRDSFESMRKEQQKAFQMNPNKRKDEFDIMTLLDDSRDERRPSNKCSEVDESIEDPIKSSVSLQSSRPLVPPGFVGATHEKKYNAGEQQEDKGNDTRSPQTTQSSKFAEWFLEEDRKPMDDPISRPADFSLSGHETNALGSDASDNWQKSFLESPSITDELIKSDIASSLISKQEAVSSVLTCEDLENSMLSGFNESNKIQPPPRQPQSLLDHGRNKAGSEAPSANIDDRASLHLLSLLNKRTDMLPNPHVDTRSSYKVDSFEGESVGNAPNNLREAHDSPPVNLGQNSTLETLFGTNFMKELQSVGAPVSSQRGVGGGSAIFEGLGPQGFHSTHINGTLPGGEGDLVASGSGNLAPNQRQRSDIDKMEGQYSLFDHFQTEAHRPPHQAHVQSKFDYVTDKQGEMRFAEEISRNSVGDPLSIRGFMPPAKSERGDLFNIAEQLAAINGNFKPLAFRVPFDNNKVDPNSLQNHLHRQQPSPQIQPQQSNSHMGFESYPGLSDSQRNMIPEDSILHDLQSGRRIPSSRMMHPTIRNPNGGVSGFGSPNQHHHHLGQQMHMSGNFTTPYQFQGFVRGGSHPQVAAPQANHQVPGFVHRQNSMQGAFPFGHQHSNFGGPQMPLLGSPEVGGGINNHPQALQRLLEMELRSKAKQQQMMHNSQGGSYGHEQDTGFRRNR